MLEGILNAYGYRYLKGALVLSAVSIALYVSQGSSGAQPPNGGTWQGYVLGTIGALLIFWLSLLGVRKRSYRSNLGSVRGWTSAHVYLGLALLLVATLHCALQFGSNVHTLAYVLMCLVVGSGMYGLWVYLTLPNALARNAGGRDFRGWREELDEVDSQIDELSARCDGNLRAMVLSAMELTTFPVSTGDQLRARDRSRVVTEEGSKPVPNPDQSMVIRTLASRIPRSRKQRESSVLNELLDAFGRRQVILRRLREEARLRALLRIWLFFHIPLTVALLAALAVHIISVFLYW